MEVLAGQVLTGGPWSLAVYGKGCEHWIFLDNRTLHFSKGPGGQVLVIPQAFGFVIREDGGVRVWFHELLEVKFLPSVPALAA